MAFISNGMCYRIDENGTHPVSSIPADQVQYIRSSMQSAYCFVTDTHSFSCLLIDDHRVDKRQLPVDATDICPIDINIPPPNNHVPDHCYLTCNSVVRIVNRKNEEVHCWENVVCMCSDDASCFVLNTSGDLMCFYHEDGGLLLNARLDLTWGVDRMSYYSDEDYENYTLSLWGNERVAIITIDCRSLDSIGYIESSPTYVPMYVQSTRTQSLILTQEGDVVTPHGTYPGYVSVVSDVNVRHLEWYGVRNDGSYDVINTTSIRPGTGPYNITMTNTDRAHTHHATIKSALS